MAQSSQRLTGAVATLATSQASFMRSAADADTNIGLSKSQPFIHYEVFAAQRIDNTVHEQHQNGLAPASRDTKPLPPDDYDPDDLADPRHGTFDAGHDDATPERADALNAFHRERGRAIRMLEKQLPAYGYMNSFSNIAQQQSQWTAHPMTLIMSLTEEDVRKGEYTMSKFLAHHRWFTEYGKAGAENTFHKNAPHPLGGCCLCS